MLHDHRLLHRRRHPRRAGRSRCRGLGSPRGGRRLALCGQVLVNPGQARLQQRLQIDPTGRLYARAVERGIGHVDRGRLPVDVGRLAVHDHVAQVDHLARVVQRPLAGADRDVHHVFGARRPARFEQSFINDLQHWLVRLHPQDHAIHVRVRTASSRRGLGVVRGVEHCRLTGDGSRGGQIALVLPPFLRQWIRR